MNHADQPKMNTRQSQTSSFLCYRGKDLQTISITSDPAASHFYESGSRKKTKTKNTLLFQWINCNKGHLHLSKTLVNKVSSALTCAGKRYRTLCLCATSTLKEEFNKWTTTKTWNHDLNVTSASSICFKCTPNEKQFKG